MEENVEEEPADYQAHDYVEVDAELSALLNPNQTTRYEEDQPRQIYPEATHRIGKPSVKFYVIEQVREGVAAVFDLAIRRKYHENL